VIDYCLIYHLIVLLFFVIFHTHLYPLLTTAKIRADIRLSPSSPYFSAFLVFLLCYFSLLFTFNNIFLIPNNILYSLFMSSILPDSIHSFIISLLFSSRTTSRYFKVIPYNTIFSKKLLFAFLPLKPRVFSLFLFYI